MEKKSALFLTQAAMIAALYVVLTYIANLFGLASGVIQIRLSEMLCILPVFTPAAIPGLFIGCLLSNILTGCVIWDILFGSLATLAGAIGTYLLRNHKFVFTLPPVAANMIVVPLVLSTLTACRTLSGIWRLPWERGRLSPSAFWECCYTKFCIGSAKQSSGEIPGCYSGCLKGTEMREVLTLITKK